MAVLVIQLPHEHTAACLMMQGCDVKMRANVARISQFVGLVSKVSVLSRDALSGNPPPRPTKSPKKLQISSSSPVHDMHGPRVVLPQSILTSQHPGMECCPATTSEPWECWTTFVSSGEFVCIDYDLERQVHFIKVAQKSWTFHVLVGNLALLFCHRLHTNRIDSL